MSADDLVRPSRDGDQFHYAWAARRCLELLTVDAGLSAVSIEGASVVDKAGEGGVIGLADFCNEVFQEDGTSVGWLFEPQFGSKGNYVSEAVKSLFV